ncbi:MAG: hypothetical protein NZ903_01650, partial [Candidatus Micrarchaeota archaeon]|nr:hypothetical protein [Candidatus Micrarchaeota archaeon]
IVIRDDNVFIVDWEFIAKEGEEILAIVGSAAYSPKDIGERVSAKQDVYSLGVIINEMVTGSAIATYAGERQSELFKIVNDAIAQKADMKEIRQGLENLLKKMNLQSEKVKL